MLRVEKRKGRIEDFDRHKIAVGVLKSGASNEVADSVAILVEFWAQETTEDGLIKSSDIRNKVIEILRLVDRESANIFESYQKPAV